MWFWKDVCGVGSLTWVFLVVGVWVHIVSEEAIDGLTIRLDQSLYHLPCLWLLFLFLLCYRDYNRLLLLLRVSLVATLIGHLTIWIDIDGLWVEWIFGWWLSDHGGVSSIRIASQSWLNSNGRVGQSSLLHVFTTIAHLGRLCHGPIHSDHVTLVFDPVLDWFLRCFLFYAWWLLVIYSDSVFFLEAKDRLVLLIQFVNVESTMLKWQFPLSLDGPFWRWQLGGHPICLGRQWAKLQTWTVNLAVIGDHIDGRV